MSCAAPQCTSSVGTLRGHPAWAPSASHREDQVRFNGFCEIRTSTPSSKALHDWASPCSQLAGQHPHAGDQLGGRRPAGWQGFAPPGSDPIDLKCVNPSRPEPNYACVSMNREGDG